MSNFSAGQMVVCIDASDSDGRLVCGESYEIRDTCGDTGMVHTRNGVWNEIRFELLPKEPKKESMKTGTTKKPHIHAETIKLWADGETIEYSFKGSNDWSVNQTPLWDSKFDYRVKSIQEFPKTSLTSTEIESVWIPADSIEQGCIDVANEAIKHFIISGDMGKYVESLK